MSSTVLCTGRSDPRDVLVALSQRDIRVPVGARTEQGGAGTVTRWWAQIGLLVLGAASRSGLAQCLRYSHITEPQDH